MKMRELYLLSGFAAVCLALPSERHVVHETRLQDVGAKDMIARHAADANAHIPFRVALKQKNLDIAEKKLLDVSMPDSPNYGKHWSVEQVRDFFAPDEDNVRDVKEWLINSGIVDDDKNIKVSHSGTWMQLNTTVGKVQKATKAQYFIYDNVHSESKFLGTESYSLPETISPHVDFIMPGVAFGHIDGPTPQTKKSAIQRNTRTHSPGDPCWKTSTVACLKQLYNIPTLTTAQPNNTLGIFGDLGQTFSQGSLNKWFTWQAPEIPQGTHPFYNILSNGPPASSSEFFDGIEAELDVQVSYGIIWPQQITFWSMGFTFPSFYGIWEEAVDADYCKTVGNPGSKDECGTKIATNIMSSSYGTIESGIPAKIARRECNEVMKLGLRGISVFEASGDNGVLVGKTCAGKNADIFGIDYFSGCPYVTSVGSTALPQGGNITDPERTTYQFGSGGGFSNIYEAPDWQAPHLANYFAKYDPGYPSYNTTDNNIPDNGGKYNRIGRAFPDISALGQDFPVQAMGQQKYVGGTSMSAPLTASIVNRINEARLKAGKTPVGFINPALYKAPADIFNDVTVGNMTDPENPTAGNCGTGIGFSAVPGYDPVSGLGTPRYEKWEAYFLSLP